MTRYIHAIVYFVLTSIAIFLTWLYDAGTELIFFILLVGGAFVVHSLLDE